jgi:hypothetical protein
MHLRWHTRHSQGAHTHTHIYCCLADPLHLGGVEVKGKGMMHTYIWDPTLHSPEAQQQSQSMSRKGTEDPASGKVDEEWEAARAHARAAAACKSGRLLVAGCSQADSNSGSQRCVCVACVSVGVTEWVWVWVWLRVRVRALACVFCATSSHALHGCQLQIYYLDGQVLLHDWKLADYHSCLVVLACTL